VEVTPAHTSDQAGARCLLIGLKPLQPRLELIWADGSYSGEPLATWCAAEGAWRLEIITPTPHVQGFVVRPWCWIVERTLGWLGRQRRLSKDYERKVQTSETLLKLAMIRLMVRRLARSTARLSKHALRRAGQEARHQCRDPGRPFRHSPLCDGRGGSGARRGDAGGARDHATAGPRGDAGGGARVQHRPGAAARPGRVRHRRGAL